MIDDKNIKNLIIPPPFKTTHTISQKPSNPFKI
jgi:hypothetical protein